MRLVLDLQGHNVPSLLICVAAAIGEITYVYRHMREHRLTLIGVSTLVGAVVFGVLNTLVYSLVSGVEIDDAKHRRLAHLSRLDDQT